jgi:MtN3 and saliva related transmembrane protein
MEQLEAVIQGIGYIAGILTTVAFVPQLVKTWRSGSTGDLSLTMLTTFASEFSCGSFMEWPSPQVR